MYTSAMSSNSYDFNFPCNADSSTPFQSDVRSLSVVSYPWLHTAHVLIIFAHGLVATGAASASAADALDLLVLLQLLPGHAANARAVEVRLLGLNAPQAAQLKRRVPVSIRL